MVSVIYIFVPREFLRPSMLTSSIAIICGIGVICGLAFYLRSLGLMRRSQLPLSGFYDLGIEIIELLLQILHIKV